MGAVTKRKTQISKIGILSTIVAVILTTVLVATSLPTIEASELCQGKTVIVRIGGEPMGPFAIDSYSYNTENDKKKKKNMFMFTHEVDEMLSAKMLAALKDRNIVEIHFTTCLEIGNNVFKEHTVWLTGVSITSISETVGDDKDDFPKEKISGKFINVMRVTKTF